MKKQLPGEDGMDIFRRLIWRDTGKDPGKLSQEQRYAAKQLYHGELYSMTGLPGPICRP